MNTQNLLKLSCLWIKYLGVIINSSMKRSSDVVRQTSKFYAQNYMLLLNFRYCTNDVKCMFVTQDV